MRRPQKKCPLCHRWFYPHPRSYRQGKSRQKVCSDAVCQARRRRRNWRRWSRGNPAYRESSRVKRKLWADRHPGYWKRWRKGHPAYVTSNRREQRRRDQARKVFLAKPTPLGPVHRAKLTRIRLLGHLAKTIALPETHSRQIDGICDYLAWFWCLAKPNHMASFRCAVPE
jgi:hypothetical protein